MAHKLTSKKAKLILKEGTAKGKKLTSKQKGLFGLIAGGGKPTRLKNPKRKRSKKITQKGKTIYGS